MSGGFGTQNQWKWCCLPLCLRLRWEIQIPTVGVSEVVIVVDPVGLQPGAAYKDSSSVLVGTKVGKSGSARTKHAQ